MAHSSASSGRASTESPVSVKARDRAQDRHAVDFDLPGFVAAHEETVRSLDRVWRELGYEDGQQLERYVRDGRVPLMLHKAVLQRWAPEAAADYRARLTVEDRAMAYVVPRRVRTLARAYDAANAGARFTHATRGWLPVTAAPMPGDAGEGEEAEAPEPPTPEPSTPESEPMAAAPSPAPPAPTAPAPPARHLPLGERDLLVRLMLQLHQERDEARLEVERQKGDIRALRSTVSVLQAQLAATRKEAEDYRRMAEEALEGRQPIPLGPDVVSEIVEAVRHQLRADAPALEDDLSALLSRFPKSSAPVPS